MTGEPAPRRNRRMWAGAGLFLVLIVPLAFVAGVVSAVVPGAAILAIPGAIIGGGMLVHRIGGRDMLLGCVLAGAVTLVVAGGTCLYILSQVEF